MRSILILLLICVAANLQAAVVTFEDVTPTHPCASAPVPCIDSITTAEGFVFSHTGSSSGLQEVYVAEGGPSGNYLNTLFHPEYGASMRITHDSGQAFDLHSLDTIVRLTPGSDIGDIYISGYDETNDLVVSKLFTPLPSGWVTIEFDDSWDSVHSVEISEWSFCTFGCASIPNAVDNFSATVVPVPAAVWLFVSALGGLGWMRRKQSV